MPDPVTGTLGGVALVSGALSARATSRGLARQASAQGASLNFQKEQYNRWVGIYGDIEENLGAFYESLTPEYLETQQIQKFNQQYEQSVGELKQQFAQLDIDAGAEAELLAKGELGAARTRAGIRAAAPIQSAEIQRDFVQGKQAPGGFGEILERRAQTTGASDFATADAFASASGSFANTAGFLAGRGKDPTPDLVTQPTQFIT